MIFDANDHAALATLFKLDTYGKPVYAGYRPEAREAPNGDTREQECRACGGKGGSLGGGVGGDWFRCVDCRGSGSVSVPNVAPPQTRYLHVAPKYNPPPWVMAYLARAHYEACRVAEALGVPAAYYPRVADGTLRVLDYDVGGSQPEHTDFDLFTIVCYRSHPADLERKDAYEWGGNGVYPERLDSLSPGLHLGEIGELVGLGPATPHSVRARPYKQQSIVYFAMPDHAAVLPGRGPYGPARVDVTVGEWLKERIARSRVYK